MARAAQGRADDLLTASLLTVRCPVPFVPAMHTEMWEHPATQANVATLRSHGATVMTPASGRRTGHPLRPWPTVRPAGAAPPSGELLLAPPRLAAVRPGRRPRADQRRRHAREPLDPVRYLGNHSSGKQGFALARAAAQRGGDASAARSPAPPPTRVIRRGWRSSRIATARESRRGDDDARRPRRRGDPRPPRSPNFRPVSVADAKIKKGEAGPAPIELTTNPDILRGLVEARDEGRIPGEEPSSSGSPPRPATETGGVLDHGRAKLKRTACDLLVVNACRRGQGLRNRGRHRMAAASAEGAETALPLRIENTHVEPNT